MLFAVQNCCLICDVFVAEVQGWSLTLYGTSTPPGIDYIKEKDVGISQLTSDDFSQNSIDDSIRSSTKEAEVWVSRDCRRSNVIFAVVSSIFSDKKGHVDDRASDEFT